jgi:hypothetical protein
MSLIISESKLIYHLQIDRNRTSVKFFSKHLMVIKSKIVTCHSHNGKILIRNCVILMLFITFLSFALRIFK